MEGTYRLKFSLFEIVGKEVIHCKYIYSEPFTVYSAKRFPGMEESTFLSRSFADQGLKIRIRKEIRIRRRFGKRKGSGHQDGEEAEPKRARPRRREEGDDDDDDEECDASYSGESRRASPISEIPVCSEDEARRAYDAPNSHDDPYYAADHYPDPMADPTFAYGHPSRRPWIPGGRSEPPENVQAPSNMQMIPSPGAAI
ncbi:MAG: velvet factor-domain-containing protein, partial [Olpidium bornovanus]